MKVSQSLRNNLILSAIFALLAALLMPSFFKGIENAAYDFHMQGSGHLANSEIVLIEIDDNTHAKLGDYPTRDLIEKVLGDISQVKPRVITFTQPMPLLENDMGEKYLESLQSKAENLKQQLDNSSSDTDRTTLNDVLDELETALATLKTDEKLAARISSFPRVVLPVVLGHSKNNPDAVIDQEQFELRKKQLDSWLKNKFAFNNNAELDPVDHSVHFNLEPPNEQLTEAALFFGIRNHTLSPDNIIRKERLLWRYQDSLIPSLALMSYLVASSESTDAFNIDIEMSDGNVIIGDQLNTFTESSKIFPRFYSGGLTDNFTSYSFYDVFAESIPVQSFQNKIVLIGNTALINSSRNAYTNGQQMTGLEATAHTVSSLLNKDWIKRGNTQRTIDALVYLCIFAYLVLLAPRLSILRGWTVAILGIFALLLLEFGALEQSYWLKLFTPIIFLVLGQIAHTILLSRSNENKDKKLKKDQDLTNYQLGMAFHKQGALDLAMEKFLACSQDKALLGPLYNLGLDFERKREFSKAATVYSHMLDIDPEYLDVSMRRSEVQKVINTLTQNVTLSEASMADIFLDNKLENPKLGRYIVERELGRGAMSIVYLGRDPSIDRTVAIKVQHFTGDDIENVNKMRERFLTEARTAGKLNHPDIITIYDVGEESDLAYIAMEYLTGSSLDMYVNEIRLNDEELLDISIRIARALGYAHMHKVIHRDIKPSNILYDDKTDEIHITDFGIAHIQDAGLTQTGTVVGTPSYMSPEQITGKSVTPHSDLFSLGATMYQLFTGRLPFEADTLASLLYKITSEQPIPVESLRPDLLPQIGHVIERLLKKEPHDRYKDAEALAKDLEHCKNTLKNSV